MTVIGIKNRLASIERAHNVGVPRLRLVFVQPGQDHHRAISAAGIAPDETPVVVQFVDGRCAA